ncbi:MAG TPA: hypothetical protein VI279_11160 [Rhodocyclaceae bacterium]
MQNDKSSSCATWKLQLLFGLGFSLLAAAILFAWKLDVPDRADLIEVSGKVAEVSVSKLAGKYPARLVNIYLNEGQRSYRLTQDDDAGLGYYLLCTLGRGDEIHALVKTDALGRGQYWVWQISKENGSVLTYDQMLAYRVHGVDSHRTFGLIFAAIAGFLTILGAVGWYRNIGDQ